MDQTVKDNVCTSVERRSALGQFGTGRPRLLRRVEATAFAAGCDRATAFAAGLMELRGTPQEISSE